MKFENQNRTKVLVTGAAGQLGMAICRLLMKSNIPFLAVDKNSGNNNDYPIKTVDLLDQKKCNELFEEVNSLIHLANHSNWFQGTFEKVYGENLLMNMNTFQAAANSGCKRIVFSSSIQVLNGQKPSHNRLEQEILLPYIPMDSEMPSIPKNSYSLSKLASENLLKYFSERFDMTCISLRYPWLLNLDFMNKAVNEGGIQRENCFDGFAYLPLYSAADLAVKASFSKISGYREYFVASRDTIVQRQVSEIIHSDLSHLQYKKPLQEIDSLVDCKKVELELGWKQPKSLFKAFQKYRKLEKINNVD